MQLSEWDTFLRDELKKRENALVEREGDLAKRLVTLSEREEEVAQERQALLSAHEQHALNKAAAPALATGAICTISGSQKHAEQSGYISAVAGHDAERDGGVDGVHREKVAHDKRARRAEILRVIGERDGLRYT